MATGDNTGDTNPYIDEWWAPKLRDWLDDKPKPASKADLVDYDWFFDEMSGANWKPWMRSTGTEFSSTSATTVPVGGAFSAQTHVFNTGTAKATGAQVSFYLSTNTTISTTDIWIGSKFVDVTAGDWAAANWSGFLPDNVAAGKYYVGWIIDSGNFIDEYNYGGATADKGYHSTPITIVDNRVFPGTPTVTGPGTTSNPTPDITWTKAANATRYNVWINDAATGQVVVQNAVVFANIYTTPALAPGSYRVRVQAISNTGTLGSWSATVAFNIVAPIVPGTPTMTGPGAMTTNLRPTFTWRAATNAVKYDLWVDNLTTGQQQVIRRQNLTTTSFRPATNMARGTYQVWVRAISATGDFGAWSLARDFTIV